jgi:hypothetical protein
MVTVTGVAAEGAWVVTANDAVPEFAAITRDEGTLATAGFELESWTV